LRAISAEADVVVVIGSGNSSNTVALAKVAESTGVSRIFRVNSAAEIPEDIEGIVAVTAGASAPESLVSEVLEKLRPSLGVEARSVTVEDEYFPPPPELREILRTLGAFLDVVFDNPAVSTDVSVQDREFTAAAVLDSHH